MGINKMQSAVEQTEPKTYKKLYEDSSASLSII